MQDAESEADEELSSLRLDAEIEPLVAELRAMMWRHAGLLRNEGLLRAGLSAQGSIAERVAAIVEHAQPSRAVLELQSLLGVARAILLSALAREESRGAHFREDFPKRDDSRFCKHSVESAGQVEFEQFDSLN